MTKEENKEKIKKGLYCLVEIIIGIVLIFATESFLNSINYLFVVILSLIGIVRLITFVMDKEYEKGNYTPLVTCIICFWLSLFIYKYGNFLFIELLPSFVSLLLFIVSTGLFAKYFEFKFIPYLVVAIISIVLGIVLIFAPSTIMYTLFKVTGVYLVLVTLFDLISSKIKKYYKSNTNK